MADKSQFVDLIGDATRQKRRRNGKAAPGGKAALAGAEQQAEAERRLSNWPPGRVAQWRLENITPWKMTLKAWKLKDWT